jgi:hypothetical protein
VTLEMRLTNERWSHRRGDISSTSDLAIEKYLRRALDNLEQPATAAVGMIDAWYGRQQWELKIPRSLDPANPNCSTFV